MKKSLIALAVLAASGASFAQSTVQVYGLIDSFVGVNKAADGLTSTSTSSTSLLGSGGVDTSRWGLKGSEDLGGGLKANFKLEQGFAIDTGASVSAYSDTFQTKTANAAFSRYAYVGFSGGFGEVKLGVTGTAYDDVNGATNGVFNSALSAEANTWKSNGYIWNPANTVLYVSPVMSGVSGEVSYSLGENKTTTVDAGNITALHVKYEGGPIFASLAYQSQKVTDATDALKFVQLSASYNFGVAKLNAGYGKVSQNLTGNVNEFQIGVDYPVTGALTLAANVATSKTDANNGVADIKRTGFGLGAAYTLSKRTFVYGGYRGETNDQGGAGDLKTSLFAVGVHHVF